MPLLEEPVISYGQPNIIIMMKYVLASFEG